MLTKPDTQPDAARWRSAVARLRAHASERSAGIALTLLVELLIVLLLLSLGLSQSDEERDYVPITTFDVTGDPAPESTATTSEAEAEPTTPLPQSEPEPQASAPAVPITPALPSAIPVPIIDTSPPAPTPSAAPTGRIRAVVRSGSNYGPANTGNSRGEDSAVVGTAPDGSPLYAARWYREPTHSEMAGYLSTALPGGWGMIACKTAPDWRVEDCEVVDEYPIGSGIARATQAAAWQFRVRPPRIGGEYQVGTWVRIRMSYTNAQRVQGY